MTSWLVLGVLMLVSFSKASIFSNELDYQIKEGIEKINASEKLVKKEVEEGNREINKVSLYFSRVVNESTVEGKKIYDSYTQKAGKIMIEKFEEGIDKDKEIGALLKLLKTMKTTKKTLDERYDILKSSLKNVLVEKSSELQQLKNLFEFTEKFSTGFYKGLRVNVINCKDEECINQLVQAAETKKKVLTNMFIKYVKEMPNVSAGLKEGHRQCMLDADETFSEVLKKFENATEYISRTQGTDDLMDRFDSEVLEL